MWCMFVQPCTDWKTIKYPAVDSSLQIEIIAVNSKESQGTKDKLVAQINN